MKFKKGHTPWNKGLKGATNSGSFKEGHPNTSPVSDAHYRWKGNVVGYSALHRWIRKVLGTPTTCEDCGKTGLTGRKIGWANRSGLYTRNLSDWIRLCKKCHSHYDRRERSLSATELFNIQGRYR